MNPAATERASPWLTQRLTDGRSPLSRRTACSSRRDPLLATAVRAVRARGTLVVAAAGNVGPKAKPAYPGAIDGVLAVTAIDHRQRPFRQAARGRRSRCAARGVELWTATLDGHGQRRSGTSIAAVHVTALAAKTRARRRVRLGFGAWRRALRPGRLARLMPEVTVMVIGITQR